MDCSQEAARCRGCYGSGGCGYCYGDGFEPTVVEKVVNTLLGLFWIGSLGLIVGFGLVGFNSWSIAGRGFLFGRLLFIVTLLLWALAFTVDHWVGSREDHGKNRQSVSRFFTLAAMILATYTALGILFFIYVAPQVRGEAISPCSSNEPKSGSRSLIESREVIETIGDDRQKAVVPGSPGG
jgi:hypothetical protein